MANYWLKQPSSHSFVTNVTAIGTAQTQTSVFGSSQLNAQTRQFRVYHTLANTVWMTQGSSAAAANSGIPIAGNQQFPEYFTASPGEIVSFYSTSTSTGYFAVTEMT